MLHSTHETNISGDSVGAVYESAEGVDSTDSKKKQSKRSSSGACGSRPYETWKMTTQQKLRQVFRFLQAKETGHDEHHNNGYVVLNGKKYFVGKMSYDEWYLEPYRKGRTERDEFSKDVLWEKYDTAELIDIFSENGLMKIEVA